MQNWPFYFRPFTGGEITNLYTLLVTGDFLFWGNIRDLELSTYCILPKRTMILIAALMHSPCLQRMGWGVQSPPKRNVLIVSMVSWIPKIVFWQHVFFSQKNLLRCLNDVDFPSNFGPEYWSPTIYVVDHK